MWISVSILLSLLFVTSVAPAPAAEVSHEDIRDAILSLVGIYRDMSDKLERHEHRERQLGEQLKKALSELDKRYRIQDRFITQMDEKLKKLLEKSGGNTEVIKLVNTVERIDSTLQNVMKELQGGSKGGQATYTIQEGPTEAAISAKLEEIATAIQNDQHHKKPLLEVERVVKKIEKQLENGVGNGLDENTLKDIKQQSHVLGNVIYLVKQASEAVANLPQKSEIFEALNATGDVLQEVKDSLQVANDNGVSKALMKLEDKLDALSTGQDDLMKTTSEVQSMTEGFNNVVSQSYEQLLSEIKGLSQVERVMIQTADNVMDTKRRVEYGVHQILLEMKDVVKSQGKTLNGTVNKRFDDIESTILDNQMGSLTNLSSKIETEISQVWRQIGIMYQQLTASASALDRLQQQTDAYVNGSVKTMDSMEGKVGMITSRMTEVDENLNFLLGRLSLVTSEYNQIKSGLAGALDDIRDSFLQVQSKLKDVGPGPKPIPEEKEPTNELPNDD